MAAKKLEIWSIILCWILVPVAAYSEDYMTSSCGQQLYRNSGRFETSTSLNYSPLLDCTVTITVAEGSKVAIMFKRFDIEEKLEGKCVDIFNMYDGVGVSGSKINTDGDWCGFKRIVPNLYSKSNDVTFTFKTDNNANYRGFEIIYTQFTPAPCTALDFQCNNSMCIEMSMRCDELSQCGDESDELNCEDLIKLKEVDELPIGLIVGCIIGGLFLIIIIAVIIWKIYDYYRWRRFLKLGYWSWKGGLYQYPVTDKYSKYDIGVKGRRHQSNYYSTEQTTTSTMATVHTTETVTVTETSH